MFRRLSQVSLLVALLPMQALANGDAWLGERFDVTIRDQSLRDVLAQFGTMVGVPTIISDRIDGTVSAKFSDVTGEEILDAFAKRYALDWRFDGRRLEVSSNSEQVSRVFDMGGVSSSELIKALEALDSYDSRYPLSVLDGQLALLVGPPRYVAIVEIVLAELAERRAIELEAARIERENNLRLEQLRAEALARASVKRPVAAISDAPLINRGGQWGG